MRVVLTHPSCKQVALATQILQISSLNKKESILNYGEREIFQKSRPSRNPIFPNAVLLNSHGSLPITPALHDESPYH